MAQESAHITTNLQPVFTPHSRSIPRSVHQDLRQNLIGRCLVAGSSLLGVCIGWRRLVKPNVRQYLLEYLSLTRPRARAPAGRWAPPRPHPISVDHCSDLWRYAGFDQDRNNHHSHTSTFRQETHESARPWLMQRLHGFTSSHFTFKKIFIVMNGTTFRTIQGDYEFTSRSACW